MIYVWGKESSAMPLPANFSSSPGEEPWRDFRNLCIQFKKLIKSSDDSEELQRMMEQFINDSRAMSWHHKTSGHYHKDVAEKMTGRVFSEFKRYIAALQNPGNANRQNLLDAITEVEKYIDNLR